MKCERFSGSEDSLRCILALVEESAKDRETWFLKPGIIGPKGDLAWGPMQGGQAAALPWRSKRWIR